MFPEAFVLLPHCLYLHSVLEIQFSLTGGGICLAGGLNFHAGGRKYF